MTCSCNVFVWHAQGPKKPFVDHNDHQNVGVDCKHLRPFYIGRLSGKEDSDTGELWTKSAMKASKPGPPTKGKWRSVVRPAICNSTWCSLNPHTYPNVFGSFSITLCIHSYYEVRGYTCLRYDQTKHVVGISFSGIQIVTKERYTERCRKHNKSEHLSC